MTLYSSLVKSPIPFHLTSLIPRILILALLISLLIFSNFPLGPIVRTFQVPTLYLLGHSEWASSGIRLRHPGCRLTVSFFAPSPHLSPSKGCTGLRAIL